MKILIFGATGLLGQALVRQWTGDELLAMGSTDADIRDSAKCVKLSERIVRIGLCCLRLTPT